MRDPVTCADGHSYERAHIESWLATNNTSPRTGAQLPNSALTPNHALRNAVEEWLSANFELVANNGGGDGGGGEGGGEGGGGDGGGEGGGGDGDGGGEGGGGDGGGDGGGGKDATKMSLVVVVVSLACFAFFDKSSAGRMPWESTEWSPMRLCALTMVVVSLAYFVIPFAAAAIAERERAQAAVRAEKERAEAAARAEEALKDALDSGLTLKQLRAKGYVEGLKAVGITCAEAKSAGYTLEEVRIAA